MNANEIDIPEWLVKARTTLMAKNTNTQEAKNYRPIACENIMMKVYTGCLARLIEEHCVDNNIIFPEQAGAKKGMWGCTDQLLINKVVSDKVKPYHHNLCTVWLDYKKVYDSVPHEWICKSLRLAKVPEHIVQAIERIIKSWKTELSLPTANGNILVGDIVYKKGVLQGDYLSVILFILSLNPSSFLLNETEGYKMGPSEDRNKNLTHLFFVDDLKLFASTLNQAKYLLDVITTFSRDIK